MHHDKLSSFIATKLTVPRLGRGMVDRPRLFQLVAMEPSPRLIVITAPAGFGKTSFAASWLARLRATGHRTAWLTIDAEDNEPARFLHCLARALYGTTDSANLAAIGFAADTSLAAPQSIVSAMINHLAEVDEEVFLVFDDFHLLTDAAIYEAVSLLSTHAPANFHLVLTTRLQTSLSLARLRANGELLEIDAAALRFDVDETRHFLHKVCEDRLAPATISRLFAGTAGWAAALRLVAGELSRGGQSADVWTSESSRPITAYMEEILASWADDEVEFVTRVSILESLRSDLCHAVTGVLASDALLERVARRHLLLELVDDGGRWYRFHRLLLDHLRQRLRTHHPDEVPHLHRRAFTWYAEREMWTDAARHAVAAGDIGQALAWISECGMALVKRGDLLTLLGWQRQFPVEIMRSQVKLRLAIVWGMTLAMRIDEAKVMLEEVEHDAQLQNGLRERPDILWECQVLRAVMFSMADDTVASRAVSEECIARSSSDPWNTNVLSNVLRFARWKAGDIEAVYTAPWIQYSLEQDRRNVYSSVFHHCVMGSVELDQVRFDLAERQAREATRLAVTHVGPQSSAAAICAPLTAELLYERGHIHDAESLLIESLSAIDALMSLEGVRYSYIFLVRVAALRSDIENAYALLSQAESLGYQRKWDRLVSGMLFERTRLLLSEGRFAEASACVTRLERLAALNPVTTQCAHSEIHRDWNLAQVELAIVRGRLPEAIDLLEGLYQDAQAARSPRRMMQFQTKLAIALMASNDADGAMKALQSALEVAAPASAYRSILDAGQEIGSLLARFRASSRCSKALLPCVEHLLAECCSDVAGGSELSPVAIANLSRRELDVLALINDGRSNKEVARALGITPETVKTHLKSVFSKLSVKRRAQAVARARNLGLL